LGLPTVRGLLSISVSKLVPRRSGILVHPFRNLFGLRTLQCMCLPANPAEPAGRLPDGCCLCFARARARATSYFRLWRRRPPRCLRAMCRSSFAVKVASRCFAANWRARRPAQLQLPGEASQFMPDISTCCGCLASP
jgi:hypothetical protein